MRFRLLFVAFIITLLWLLLPIALPLSTAFSENPIISFPPKGFTLKWFYDVFNISDIVNGFKLSLTVAFSATSLTIIATLPLSYKMARSSNRYREIWESLFELPIVIPQMVLGFALFIFFVRYLQISSVLALIVGHMVVISPYALSNVYAGISWMNWEMEDAAVSLGASRIRAFFEVVLPNARNALISAFLSCFLTSFNAVEISLFLSIAGTSTLPVAMLNFLAMRWDPAISALSAMLVLFMLILVLLSEYIFGGRGK